MLRLCQNFIKGKVSAHLLCFALVRFPFAALSLCFAALSLSLLQHLPFALQPFLFALVRFHLLLCVLQSDAELVAGFQVLEEPETDWMEQPGVDFMFNTTAFIKALLEEGVFYCENMPDVLLWDWRFNSEKTPPEAAKKYPPASQSLFYFSMNACRQMLFFQKAMTFACACFAVYQHWRVHCVTANADR